MKLGPYGLYKLIYVKSIGLLEKIAMHEIIEIISLFYWLGPNFSEIL